MNILAFETSSKFLSIAYLEDDVVKASFHEDVGIRHSDMLISEIENVLKSADAGPVDIDLICTGLGPGSFTGLRIAVSTIKALAAVLKTDIVGVPTMDAIVLNVPGEYKTAAPFMDARKDKVYTCFYEFIDGKWKRKTDYLLITVDELLNGLKEEVFFFGDGIIKYTKELDSCGFARHNGNIDWYPKAVDIARLGYEISLTKKDDPAEIDPLYLHARDCNITKPK